MCDAPQRCDAGLHFVLCAANHVVIGWPSGFVGNIEATIHLGWNNRGLGAREEIPTNTWCLLLAEGETTVGRGWARKAVWAPAPREKRWGETGLVLRQRIRRQ